jgi:threonine dehydrogenase-like Zn-dependent dehydrogenase
MGYMISCSSPLRAAYGWQRDGGMAEYVLCDEKDLVELPDSLSYTDGAQVACGFGTVFEAIQKVGVDGSCSALVVGLGPVGLATLMLCRAMGAQKLIGIEGNPVRAELAKKFNLADAVLAPAATNVDEIRSLTGGTGAERAIDAAASDAGRATAVRAARQWGKIAFVGEGGQVNFNPSPDIIHPQKTIYGSWVTSIWLMEDLVEYLVRWNLHPEILVTHRFPLEKAAEAYALMASGSCGKVSVCFDEELKQRC